MWEDYKMGKQIFSSYQFLAGGGDAARSFKGLLEFGVGAKGGIVPLSTSCT